MNVVKYLDVYTLFLEEVRLEKKRGMGIKALDLFVLDRHQMYSAP